MKLSEILANRPPQLVQIEAAEDRKLTTAMHDLTVAVGYVGEDGTKKLCGQCRFWTTKQGDNPERCTLLGKKVYVPYVASCSYFAKGSQLQDPTETPMKTFTPEEVGLVIGQVQCKRCIRSAGDGTCAALTSVLQNVLGFKDATFKIVPSGCCNWNRVKGQKDVVS